MTEPQAAQPETSSRKRWETPAIVDLPRLVNLTLQTGGGIPGGGDVGGGSTVIP